MTPARVGGGARPKAANVRATQTPTHTHSEPGDGLGDEIGEA